MILGMAAVRKYLARAGRPPNDVTDPHAACRTTITSLAQQRDTAIAMMNQATEANIRMASEIVRLSRAHTPVIPEGELDAATSTRDNDNDAAIALRDPERARRPDPGPMRVDG